MEILESLNWRYATKVFNKDKKISEEDLQKVLDSLVLSPSSYGLQPWRFVVVENPAIREELKSHSWNQGQVTDASHLLVLCRIDDFSEKFIDDYLDDMCATTWATREDMKGYEDMMKWNLLSRDEETLKSWAAKQVYIALGQAWVVCAELWIDTCPMEGFDPAKYDEILWLKEKGMASVLVLPIGYRDESDKYSTNPKIRYSKEKIVTRIS